MSQRFEKLDNALDAGYTLVNRHADKDVSGSPYFGYDFESELGQRSVDVYFTHEKNSANSLGCVRPMYPPVAQ